MRIGLIGLGRIGAMHATTLSQLPAVTSLVVTDAVPAAVEATARRLGVEVAADPAALLRSGVDGVVIAAATPAHPELVLAALDAGVPVFCEKPVAADPADSLEVLRRTAETGVPVQIGYPRRFDPGFAAAREAVTSGELGWLHTVRSTTLDPGPPPDAYVRASGGIFRDCSVHDFDAVRFVTGQEVVAVYATGANQGAPIFAEVGDVDTAAVVLTMDGGTLGVVSSSRYNARGYDVRLEVHGAQDSVAAGVGDRWPMRSVEPGASPPAGSPHASFVERFADAFRAELAAFTEVAAGTRPSPVTVADAVEIGWIAEAAARSLREGRPVAMDDVRRSALPA